MPSAKQSLGFRGETLAEKYLIKKGLTPFGRNYFTRWGEIDLIMLDKKQKKYVFVEVKTRTNKKYGPAIEGITRKKFKNLISSIQVFFLRHRRPIPPSFQVDVVGIDLNSSGPQITHIQNVGEDDF